MGISTYSMFGGKSSAALLLAALVSGTGERRATAEAAVPSSLAEKIRRGFSGGAKRWRIVGAPWSQARSFCMISTV